MSEDPRGVAEAVVRERRKLSFVWIVPIVAALIGGFLSYRAFMERGPAVTITFENASGLEAGKTLVRFKDVEIGKVESIELAEDLSHVTVSARLAAGSQRFLTDETKFWVERARVSAGQVSGLGTLLSGAYIGIDPSTEGKRARTFVGLEEPPPFTSDVPGTRFRLAARSPGSLSVGSPVYFRWLEVGRITKLELDPDGEQVDLEVFVRAPHDARVREETRFWNSSGFDASLTTEGFTIDTVSLTTLLIGGVSFDTPPGSAAKAPDEDHVFRLFASKAESKKPTIRVRRPWLLHFEQSVAGLVEGSPVEFRGIQVGEVVDVRMTSSEEGLPRISVRIVMEPERAGLNTKDGPEALKRNADELVKAGLRAQLKSNNILTGQLAVSLDFHPNAEPAAIDWSGPIPEFPTVQGGMDQLLAALNDFTRQLGELPLDEIGGDVQQAVEHLNEILANVETATPALVGTLENAEATLGSANALIAPESPLTNDLKRTLSELSQAARSLRLLADQLEQQPESLLRGKE